MPNFEMLVLVTLLTLILSFFVLMIFLSIEIHKRKIKKLILSLSINSDKNVLLEIYYHFFKLFQYYQMVFFVNVDTILVRKKLNIYQLWVKKIILPWDNLWTKVFDYEIKEISLDELKKGL